MACTSDTLIEMAPGVYVDPLKRRELDPAQSYVLLDEKGLRQIGLSSSQMKLIDRLNHAGLIEVYPVTPRRKLLKMSSWELHLSRVREEPEFWEHPKMRARWRVACMAI